MGFFSGSAYNQDWLLVSCQRCRDEAEPDVAFPHWTTESRAAAIPASSVVEGKRQVSICNRKIITKYMQEPEMMCVGGVGNAGIVVIQW